MLETMVQAHSTRRARYEGRDKRTDPIRICDPHSDETGTQAVVTEPFFGIGYQVVYLQGGAVGTQGALLREAPRLLSPVVRRSIRKSMS
jgi:hypothetical protein